MVIQRLQSVFLLIAVVLMALAACWTANLGVMILNAAVAVLLFIDIFMFKNLNLQIRVAGMSAVLIVASMIACAVMMYLAGGEDMMAVYKELGVLLFALVFTILAQRYMMKDRKLLRSYDRLR